MAPFIRAAQIGDISVIREFIRDLATYERLLHEVEATDEKLRNTLFPADGRPAAECVLAFKDEVPVGFAVYFTTYSTFLAKPGLHLEDLFVKPPFRGQGIGKALMVHLAKLACERGYGRMEWTVLDWNKPSIDFYRALGATMLDEWKLCRLTGAALQRFA